MRSEFDKWFKKQFGLPPKEPTPRKVRNYEQAALSKDDWDYYFRLRDRYNAKKEAALKAWCARDKEGGGE